MRILVVGATGALGRPLVRRLAGRGHDVVGTTRTPARRMLVEESGARAVVVDALDSRAVDAAVRETAPEVLVQALTAIPAAGPRRASDLTATNALRRVATANLLAAAVDHGVRRVVAESMVLVHGDVGGRVVADEDTPVAQPGAVPVLDQVIAALRSLEDQVRGAGVDGVVLRYGMFYGPGAGTPELADQLRRRILPLPGGRHGLWPWIQVDDAAAATVAAVEAGAPPDVVEVVDDEAASVHDVVAEIARAYGVPPPWTVPGALARRLVPYLSTMAALRLAVSNARARRELGWAPRFPSYREGIRDLVVRTGGAGGAVREPVR